MNNGFKFLFVGMFFWIGRKHRQRTHKYPIYQKLLQIIITTHAVFDSF